jgi:PAS domain-containing protein
MQGVIIMDTDRRIRVVSSGAEDLLGWKDAQVKGLSCSLVLDCQDADGCSACTRCGGTEALERREITPFTRVSAADASGGRQPLDTSFWFLPPAGGITEARLMMVLTDELTPARRDTAVAAGTSESPSAPTGARTLAASRG